MDKAVTVRKLPKQTKIIFAMFTVIAIIVYMLTKDTQKKEAGEILFGLGYENFNDLQVYSKKKVEDKITRIQGYKYFVKFNDKSNNKKCKGFILKDFKRKIAQDIICK